MQKSESSSAMGRHLADLSRAEWRDLYSAVLLYASRIAGSRDSARELAQEAFDRLFTTREWTPATQPSLERHMFGIVKSLLSNERQSKRRARERAFAAAFIADDAASVEDAGLERVRAAHRQQRADDMMRSLRERLAGHPLELALVDLTAEGVERPAEQAELTKRTLNDVYEARRRIQRFAKSLAADAAGEEDAP